MRIFNDAHGVMNQSLLEREGSLLVVSQFTLMAATKKGNRPSYIRAAKHEHAIPLYEFFLKTAQEKLGKKIVSGTFGADMEVALVNDGPVTIQIDSKNKE
jgi:D-tyrosyl-tRNA(Tyr) deacylase